MKSSITHLIVSLLQGDGQRREAVFGRQGLVGSGREQESDDAVVVLLRGHVQRGEPVLGLHVDRGAIVDQYSNHLLLNWEQKTEALSPMPMYLTGLQF